MRTVGGSVRCAGSSNAWVVVRIAEMRVTTVRVLKMIVHEINEVY